MQENISEVTFHKGGTEQYPELHVIVRDPMGKVIETLIIEGSIYGERLYLSTDGEVKLALLP